MSEATDLPSPRAVRELSHVRPGARPSGTAVRWLGEDAGTILLMADIAARAIPQDAPAELAVSVQQIANLAVLMQVALGNLAAAIDRNPR
jgi:hypothetical protein